MFVQIGRLAAGWVDFDSNCGIAPITQKVIPVSERLSFHRFTQRLMESSLVRVELQRVLTLVLLLRYDDVEREYPRHALLLRLDACAVECGVNPAMLRGWIIRATAFFAEENSAAMAMSQVRVDFPAECIGQV